MALSARVYVDQGPVTALCGYSLNHDEMDDGNLGWQNWTG
jgi:hypothetical protein